jgi:hypothetical protein
MESFAKDGRSWRRRRRLDGGRRPAVLYCLRCAVLALSYLLVFAFLAASYDRYQQWHRILELRAVAGEPVKKIDRWKAACTVRPWLKVCQPKAALKPVVRRG